ncbi:PorP/SprF family type IX secretion system membrane protein [Fluviicola taffensis]|uniref:Putative membrane protein n=1 Tax=Fluviicola taffensis (strain DSM 16823 / NCIMB 13979 / RW262) TaxID=755732 RepID=F2IEJ5_FLUTR|nr:type IX secretion system membrane protein PorP/SprF [Fluviicola taffensis]AEA44534.1 putative membrane protein [Fluviicola taffensis DSM 16823]
MRNIKLLAFVGCLFGTCQLYAQDPTFTQFYANPLYLNPAFAGSHGCARFSMNYRNEWPSLSGNYVTYSASYDQHFKNISGGIGILATHDMQGQGTINTSMLGLIYSYHLKVNRKFAMLFGARAAWYQKFLDWDKLTFGDMIDPRRGFIYQTGDQRRGGSKGFFDASAGFVGYSKHFFFGGAVHHLNMPNESVIIGNSPMPMRFTGHIGAEIPLGGKSKYQNTTSIMPNIIYQYQQGFQEINIGTYIKYGAFTAGAWFRNRDAFILTIGVNTGTFRIGYSYDVTVSRLNNGVSGGSHEVSLGIYTKCKTKGSTFKTISCPSF